MHSLMSTALQSNVFFSLSVEINLPTGRPVTAVHHVSPAPCAGSRELCWVSPAAECDPG